MFGGLHVIRVEHNLTEFDVGHHYPSVDCHVPEVVGGVYNFWVHMELHWIAGPPLDPEAGHEQHYVVAAVGCCELGELLPCCLGRIIYCVYVVF